MKEKGEGYPGSDVATLRMPFGNNETVRIRPYQAGFEVADYG